MKRFPSKDSRNLFFDLLKEAFKLRQFEKPIVLEEEFKAQEQAKRQLVGGSGAGLGIGGIKRTI